MSVARRLGVLLVLVVAATTAAIIAPAAALAGTVEGGPESYTYTDAAAQTNDLVVTRAGGNLVFTDPAGLTENSPDCDDDSPTVVTCTGDEDDFFTVNVLLGTGDDEVDGSGAPDTRFVQQGGPGEDTLTGGPVGDSISGNTEDDTVVGLGGDDNLNGDDGTDNLSGGAGFDRLDGGAGGDTLAGGDDDDELFGDQGADTLSGGPSSPDGCGDEAEFFDKSGALRISLDGVANDDTTDGDTLLGDIESIAGGEGGDTFTGNDATNCLGGRDGDDTLDGLGGQDQLSGNQGADTMLGGAGDDVLSDTQSSHPPSADVYAGGDGIDRAFLTAATCEGAVLFRGVPFGGCTPRDISVTFDDQPNDGGPGEGDNVRADVEDVDVEGVFGGAFALARGNGFGSFKETAGRVSLIGSAGFNVLGSAGGDDTIEPREGSDSVFARGGADVINARDGFTDRVDCGPGGDTANVDQLDVVLACEVVNTETVAVALEDRPPTVTLDAPTGNALTPDAPTPMRATATDDKGLQRVLFMDDDRIVCNDDAPPYECAYQPRGEDVGRDTLAAVALDTGQQAATAMREVAVARFKPTGLTLKRSSSRARPARVKASGVLRLPAALSKTLGCRGTVKIAVRVNGRTVATRRAKVARTCRYSKRLVVGNAAATLKASFGGNAFAKKASSKRIKARRG